MNPVIQNALSRLSKADYAGYFSAMDQVTSGPLRHNLNELRGRYVSGNKPWDFAQQLELFAHEVNAQLTSTSIESSITSTPGPATTGPSPAPTSVMTPTTPPSDSKLPDSVPALVAWFFSLLPKKVAVLLAILALAAIGYWAYTKYFTPSESLPQDITITGKLIGTPSKQPLNNVTVCLENNPLQCDESVDHDGIYKIDHASIPKNKIITLVVTYADGQTVPVKDIDLAGMQQDENGRIFIPTKEINDRSIPTPQGLKNGNAVPKTVSITGRLIGIPSNKTIENVQVSLESDPHKKDEALVGGIFIIDNVTIPANKFISLVVTYPNGQTILVKDIDLSYLKPDSKGRIVIPDQRISDR